MELGCITTENTDANWFKGVGVAKKLLEKPQEILAYSVIIITKKEATSSSCARSLQSELSLIEDMEFCALKMRKDLPNMLKGEGIKIGDSRNETRRDVA